MNLTNRYRADVGRWFATARRHWGELFVPFLGYTVQGVLLLGVCGTAVVFLHFLSRNQASPVTFPLLAFTAAAVVLGPLAAAIRSVEGRAWHFNDLFAGLRRFNSLGLYTFLMAVLYVIVSTPVLFPILFPVRGGGPFPFNLAGLVYVSLLAPFVILAVQAKLTFALCLVFDRRMGMIDAMEISWRMTDGHFWPLLGLQLLLWALLLGGLLAFGVGLLFTCPLVLLIQAAAYVDATSQT